MWASIERKPGVYDWADYDRQMELAAKHGIKTVVAELTHSVPDWAYRKWQHARQLRSNGQPLSNHMGVSSSTGGFAHNGAGALTMRREPSSTTANSPIVSTAKNSKCGFMLEC